MEENIENFEIPVDDSLERENISPVDDSLEKDNMYDRGIFTIKSGADDLFLGESYRDAVRDRRLNSDIHRNIGNNLSEFW